MALPKKNTAYQFYTALTDAASPADFKVSPTLAAGDFQVSIDGGSFANLDTLPVVAPAGSVMVQVNLSADEMNGDKVVVHMKDVAGAEWEEVVEFIDVPESTTDEIAVEVDELWQLQGLDSANPMTVKRNSRVAGSINLAITGDEQNTTIVTRT